MHYFEHYKHLVGVPSYPDYKSVSPEEWKEACKIIEDKVSEATELWYRDFREEWADLSDDLFNLCYGEAYYRGHSSGYDEVANYMGEIVCFAKQILALKDKE